MRLKYLVFKEGYYWGAVDLKDQPSGSGKMTYQNGDVYDGEWQNGFMHGYGKLITAAGDVKEGEWAHDELIREGAVKPSQGFTSASVDDLREKLDDLTGDGAAAVTKEELRALQAKADSADAERERAARAIDELSSLQSLVISLQEQVTSLKEAQNMPMEKRRIEDILMDYLDTLSEEAEHQLAVRFRETAFALMDCSSEEAAKVMRSPVIGTDLNKRLLCNQARRSNRLDIAQGI